MRPERLLCLLLVGSSLALGTLTDGARPHRPPQAEGYFILAADLHVHSFFGDGALAPWDLRAEARRRGLDVIAVTNHTSPLAGGIRRWPDDRLPLVLPGQEVTAPRYHLIALGVTQTIDWRKPLPETIREIHALGGAAVAAHPTRNYSAAYGTDAIRALDGVEAVHPSAFTDPGAAGDFLAFYALARRIKPTIGPIGSSDFHFEAPVGLCRTYVFAREISAGAVIEAIRAGRTVAVDDRGRLTGTPELVRLTAHRPLAGLERPPVSHRLAMVSLWLGLLGLVLL